MKILAVDDDQVFLEILDQKLQSIGYTELELLSLPSAAILMLENATEVFDCILLDFEMPEMNGVELCAHIRKLDPYLQTPIIMITSLSDRKSIEHAFRSGASDYINKSLDLVELQMRLGSVKRTIEEKKRLKHIESQRKWEDTFSTPDPDFSSPVYLPKFNRGVELHILQNYLLALGVRGMLSASAVAVSIENAACLYRLAQGEMFQSMLMDVASVVEDCLKTQSIMISYYGSGNFVGVMMDQVDWDSVELEREMNAKIQDFSHFYAADRLPLPKILVSPVVSNSLFSRRRPSHILDRAVSAARR